MVKVNKINKADLFLKFSASVCFVVITVLVCIQIWGTPWNKNIRAEVTTTPYARTVTVEGDGKVTVKPDIARISLSVASTAATVKSVTEQNNKNMNAVIGELKNLGIDSKDILTSSYSLYPQYDYNSRHAQLPKIIGYSLTQSIDVKVRDLTKTDQVIDLATKAGANQVGSLYFDIDELAPIKAEARKLAFEKARDKAEQMAKAAGVKVGRVVTFSENQHGDVFPLKKYSMTNSLAKEEVMTDMASGMSPGLESGSKDVLVNVSVTYEIEE